MKLLIVDDEALTRDGLMRSIDWNSLGVSQVLLADDGANGLALAKKTIPDIILTDVRMPKMSGIEMSRRIQQQNPDCQIIFMSGYSDKAYLKAAIMLKAVRYVEKPIDENEIKEAVREAACSVTEKRRQYQTYELFQKEEASRLALRLTKPGFSLQASQNICGSLSIHSSTCFSTLILKFNKQLSDFMEADLSCLMKQLEALVEKHGLAQIHTLKNEEFLILHLYGAARPSEYALEKLCHEIKLLLNPYRQYYIVVGKTVTGPEKVYLSYHSAAILAQNAFFHPYGSILLSHQEQEKQDLPDTERFPEQFFSLLSAKDIPGAKSLALQLYEQLSCNHAMLANQAKDIYYKLLLNLSAAVYQRKLAAAPGVAETESPMELVAKCSNLQELFSLLMDKLYAFEQLLEGPSSENSTVFLIRDYIGKHFSNDRLSIKDISEHVHLSSSYICTLFKTETGQTLNQYITEYRIEKAKLLLADPRNKIGEISEKVGYSDGNYFSKSFKKAVGLSPSEYRERELS